jgi:hypothetical protein
MINQENYRSLILIKVLLTYKFILIKLYLGINFKRKRVYVPGINCQFKQVERG